MCKFTQKPIKMVVFYLKREKKHLCKKVPFVKDKIKVNNDHAAVKHSQFLGCVIAGFHLGFS